MKCSDKTEQPTDCSDRNGSRTATFAPWPRFGEEEIEAATRVLRSGKVNYWTGQEGRRFEAEFAEAAGCRHAIAVANGTLALELALVALGIGPGDEVVVTCRSFLASASCIVLRGATPVFADVDPVSQNVTADTIRAALTPRSKTIIAVHLAGWPCDMKPIMELAEQHGLKVIEDCAQAHGARDQGQPVGSLGHVAAFSFCQDKILTTAGEGGMLTTNDEDIWRRSWSYKDHGKDWDAVHHQQHGTVFKWLHHSFGTNWRMTEMQSAVGRVALRKLPEWVVARRRNAAILTEEFAKLPALRITVPPPYAEHSYYKYYAFVRPEFLDSGWTRDRIVRALQAESIPCGPGSCGEVYLEKAFAGTPFVPASRLPVARALGETGLMFRVDPALDEADMRRTASAVRRVLSHAIEWQSESQAA